MKKAPEFPPSVLLLPAADDTTRGRAASGTGHGQADGMVAVCAVVRGAGLLSFSFHFSFHLFVMFVIRPDSAGKKEVAVPADVPSVAADGHASMLGQGGLVTAKSSVGAAPVQKVDEDE